MPFLTALQGFSALSGNNPTGSATPLSQTAESGAGSTSFDFSGIGASGFNPFEGDGVDLTGNNNSLAIAYGIGGLAVGIVLVALLRKK